MPVVTIGLEAMLKSPPNYLKNGHIGLLCNAASLDSNLTHASRCLKSVFGNQLKALFTPQHGFYAEKQDNMIESPHGHDPDLAIPIHSLYSQTRIPTASMLESIDTLIIDLQDVGTRVYTFMYTMSYCMEAAQKHGIRVVVLDRPNPIGGHLVEGNCLKPDYGSFVGRFPIPMRHGLTMGELALLFKHEFEINCDLDVIPMQDWQRRMYFTQTGLPWVAPSPNLPTPASAVVYPGQVIWEGTNVSEGRGTTQPFELFGAPYLDPNKIIEKLGSNRIAGGILRPIEFEPTANKWKGELCRGFQIHVTDPDLFRPYRTSLMLLQAIMALHRASFTWKPPPYEYEYHRQPIDLILGDGQLSKKLATPEPISRIESSWLEELKRYNKLRKKYFLYE